jgi:hypothetical protein
LEGRGITHALVYALVIGKQLATDPHCMCFKHDPNVGWVVLDGAKKKWQWLDRPGPRDERLNLAKFQAKLHGL